MMSKKKRFSWFSFPLIDVQTTRHRIFIATHCCHVRKRFSREKSKKINAFLFMHQKNDYEHIITKT